jgi:hypothetical protein
VSSSFRFRPYPPAWATEDQLKQDGSDLEEKLEWAWANNDKCRWISEQATQYMQDIWMSTKAESDNAALKVLLAKYYSERFGIEIRKCIDNDQDVASKYDSVHIQLRHRSCDDEGFYGNKKKCESIDGCFYDTKEKKCFEAFYCCENEENKDGCDQKSACVWTKDKFSAGSVRRMC